MTSAQDRGRVKPVRLFSGSVCRSRVEMNKTSIEWCDYTWNPVTGCLHGCPYCYARKIADRFRGSKAWPEGFKPMSHPERLGDPAKMKKPQTIFVCSMADLFGDWVPDEWISNVMASCDVAPWHTYIFLTKNPARYFKLSREFLQRNNFWFGTTETGEIFGDPHLNAIKRLPAKNTFVSFEPLLHEIDVGDLSGIKQIIIGAQTNPDQWASLELVLKICEAADLAGAKAFMKDSLSDRWPDRELRRELAWAIHK